MAQTRKVNGLINATVSTDMAEFKLCHRPARQCAPAPASQVSNDPVPEGREEQSCWCAKPMETDLTDLADKEISSGMPSLHVTLVTDLPRRVKYFQVSMPPGQPDSAESGSKMASRPWPNKGGDWRNLSIGEVIRAINFILV